MSDAQAKTPVALPYHGFAVPRDLVERRDPIDQFGQIGDANIMTLRRFAGFDTARYVVETGCGYGRNAIPLVNQVPLDGKYLGVDLAGPEIDWARQAITAKAPNFWFWGMDTDTRGPIPVDDNSQDLVFDFRNFTFAYPDLFTTMLKDIARSLRPGGMVLMSLFVIRPGLIAHLHRYGASTTQDLTFMNMVERGFYLNDMTNPETPVGFSPRRIGSIARRARLVPTRFIKGGWSNDGGSEIDGPDAVILTKPVF